MNDYVLFLNEVDGSRIQQVGGKGANLGELCKAGFPVPEGFCITTRAYLDFIQSGREMDSLLDELNRLNPEDLNGLRELGRRIRDHLTRLEIPGQIKNAVIQAWESTGKQYSYAVRSSATAEDLPTASFAGQQDTYLNIKCEEALLGHIRKCWASLFTDRAISYRIKNGFDHRQVYLSVVVQRMVDPEVSGILFTADPLSGNRNVVSIDASFGLGEALVSGMVSADLYKVREGRILEKNIRNKEIAIFSLPEGGTVKKTLPPEQQSQPALTNHQILQLSEIGKKIEQHFGTPQDIEFCVEKGKIYVVQSRPITSLYPLPDLPQKPLQVMFSFGHVQMMTDALKPMGISVLRSIFPKTFLVEAGNRLFVNPTELLRTKPGRKLFPKAMENVFDQTLSNAIREVIRRPEFLDVPAKRGLFRSNRRFILAVVKEIWKNLLVRDPELARRKAERFIEQKWNEIGQSFQRASGENRLEIIRYELNHLGKDVLKNLFTYVICYPLSYMLLKQSVGDTRELYEINKSLSGNVTSQMGLEIGDLADIVREFPALQNYLEQAEDKTFYDGLDRVEGGAKFKEAFLKFMEKYGHRCPGEIDLTKPRWREAPTQLVPAILGHMRSVKPGEHRQKFAQGEKEANEAIGRILKQAGSNRLKRKWLKRLITVCRNAGGLREHPKYFLTRLLDECKKAILSEAEQLVAKGVFEKKDDVFFLTMDELILLLQGTFRQDVKKLINERKEAYERHQTLMPPQVMTSEGECITGSRATENLPEGALAGVPASAGVAEGIARVVFKPEEARLHEGEILVAPHTDPGWTPLFQSAKAVVTEVGGLMTHGSVVAREYGIPAVVGVDQATKRIQDGQKIRVDGNQGIVEILDDAS